MATPFLLFYALDEEKFGAFHGTSLEDGGKVGSTKSSSRVQPLP